MHLGCMRTLAIGSNDAGGAGGGGASPRLAATSRTMTNDAKTGIVFSSARAELALERQLPDSLAGRGEDRVGQRGRGDRGTRFADPARGFSVTHQVHFDGRRLLDPQRANVA